MMGDGNLFAGRETYKTIVHNVQSLLNNKIPTYWPVDSDVRSLGWPWSMLSGREPVWVHCYWPAGAMHWHSRHIRPTSAGGCNEGV